MTALETPRLILRPYRESDLPEYHRLMSDRKNMYYLNDLATDTLEESLESLRDAIKVNEVETARRFCVELKEAPDAGLIGSIGYEIKQTEPMGRVADPMGWFILPEFQNKGYITEAARRVLDFAFLEDNCAKVFTGCYKDNLPTQRVMAKVGFRLEAERPDAQLHDGTMKTRLALGIMRDGYARLL